MYGIQYINSRFLKKWGSKVGNEIEPILVRMYILYMYTCTVHLCTVYVQNISNHIVEDVSLMDMYSD